MDGEKLKCAIKSKGITAKKLCADLNMSRSAFYRKCNGTSEFTQGEIERILEYLGIKSPMGIFFAEKVSKKKQKREERGDF